MVPSSNGAALLALLQPKASIENNSILSMDQAIVNIGSSGSPRRHVLCLQRNKSKHVSRFPENLIEK